MSAVVDVVTVLRGAAAATGLRRPDVEPPAEGAVGVAELLPLLRVRCCQLIAASRRP